MPPEPAQSARSHIVTAKKAGTRATFMYRAGDVRIANIPDATIVEPTGAVIASAEGTSGATIICSRSLKEQRMWHDVTGSTDFETEARRAPSRWIISCAIQRF